MSNPLARSFQNAFSGIYYVLRTQRNARIHLVITTAVGLVGTWLGLGISQWVPLVLAAGLVWTAEIVNTAVETVVDLSSPQERSLAGTAKDVSAGAVLLSAAAAAVVGILILGPPLLARLLS
ncbi:MAG: diacylglycerol kinase family protein [Chloroflexi bacterium]|nr:diacylglycerol kinase family protein [Chloroflexota bacterium]MCH8338412.1 diacylglycerol kinase family protein [Chloroflexota bacterium]